MLKIYLLSFGVFASISEAVSNAVKLIPNQTNCVEVNTSLQLSCKLDSNIKWKTIIFESSKYLGNNIALFRNPNCDNNSGLDKTMLSNYNFSCDYSTNIFNMTIRKVLITDHDTVIECIARSTEDDRRNDSIKICVSVPIQTVEIKGPTNVTVDENCSMQLSCETSPSRPEANITWYKTKLGNDQPVRPHSNTWSNTTSSKNGLKIVTKYIMYVGMREDNGGVLYCEAENGGRSVRSKNLTLNIIYGPRTNVTYKTIYLQEGKSFNRTCKSECNPECIYKWTRENATTSNKSELEIFNADATKAGVYICKARHLDSNEYSDLITLRIDVLYGPRISDVQVINIAETGNINLSCTVESNPPANITWLYDTLALHQEYGVSSSILTVHQTFCANRTYTCLAKTNPKSVAQKDINVLSSICEVRREDTLANGNTGWKLVTIVTPVLVILFSVAVVIGFIVIKRIWSRKKNNEETSVNMQVIFSSICCERVEKLNEDNDNPDSNTGAYRDNVLYSSSAQVNPLTNETQPNALTVPNGEDPNRMVNSAITTTYGNTNRAGNQETEVVARLTNDKSSDRSTTVQESNVRSKPRERMKLNPKNDTGDYKDNILYESSEDLLNAAQTRNQLEPQMLQNKDDYKVIYNQDAQRKKNNDPRKQNQKENTFGDTTSKATSRQNEEESPVVPPRRVLKAKEQPKPLPRRIKRNTAFGGDEHVINTADKNRCRDDGPIFHPRGRQKETLQIQSVKPIIIKSQQDNKNFMNTGQESSEETRSFFGEQSSRGDENEITPSVFPRHQNYIQVDLHTDNEGIIHGKDNRTVYTDVELSGT